LFCGSEIYICLRNLLLEAKMNKTLKLSIVLSVLFLCNISFAHEIHLTDGKIIKTNSCWEETDKVYYEKFGATIQIPKENVLKIVFDFSQSENIIDKNNDTNSRTIKPRIPIDYHQYRNALSDKKTCEQRLKYYETRTDENWRELYNERSLVHKQLEFGEWKAMLIKSWREGLNTANEQIKNYNDSK
jgi:hypothetical protein